MYSLKNRIRIALKVMEAGKFVDLKSGHRLVIPDGYEEPGFLMTKTGGLDAESHEVVLQIGSSEAWMMLIQHCKEMSKEEMISLAFSIADIKLPRKI